MLFFQKSYKCYVYRFLPMCPSDEEDKTFLCRVKIAKDGQDFTAVATLSDGSVRVYKHKMPEELFAELAISLEEELEED